MGTRVTLNEEEIILLVETRRVYPVYTCIGQQCRREGNKAWMASEGAILRGGTNDNFSHVAAALLFDTRTSSDVVATIRIIYYHHVYASQRVDQRVSWCIAQLPSTFIHSTIFLQLLGACMLFQLLFEYRGIKVRSFFMVGRECSALRECQNFQYIKVSSPLCQKQKRREDCLFEQGCGTNFFSSLSFFKLNLFHSTRS